MIVQSKMNFDNSRFFTWVKSLPYNKDISFGIIPEKHFDQFMDIYNRGVKYWHLGAYITFQDAEIGFKKIRI